MAAATIDPRAFLAAYSDNGGPAADEFRYLPSIERLMAARRLRFRAHRVANADHYDETIDDDQQAVRESCLVLGLNPDRVLSTLRRSS